MIDRKGAVSARHEQETNADFGLGLAERDEGSTTSVRGPAAGSTTFPTARLPGRETQMTIRGAMLAAGRGQTRLLEILAGPAHLHCTPIRTVAGRAGPAAPEANAPAICRTLLAVQRRSDSGSPREFGELVAVRGVGCLGPGELVTLAVGAGQRSVSARRPLRNHPCQPPAGAAWTGPPAQTDAGACERFRARWKRRGGRRLR
jgi:hypothetical protein